EVLEGGRAVHRADVRVLDGAGALDLVVGEGPVHRLGIFGAVAALWIAERGRVPTTTGVEEHPQRAPVGLGQRRQEGVLQVPRAAAGEDGRRHGREAREGHELEEITTVHDVLLRAYSCRKR